MAEKDKDIDALFRAGLAHHSETPSPRSWQQLQGKLSEQKNGSISWRSIAATILLLASATSIWWYSVRMTDRQMETLAEEYIQDEPNVSVSQKDDAAIQHLPSEEGRIVEDTVRDTSLNSVNKKPTHPAKPESTPIRKTIALNDADIVPERVKEKAPRITKLEPLEPELPEVDFSPKVDGTIHKEQKEEVAYTVTIISNGITEKPNRDNLVKEIEDKIDRIGGVVYKMDQGFANLQDAKNDLFASITSKDGNEKSK